jgi:phage terminase large subunit
MRINLPTPSPKQKLFLLDTHKHVAFGGARGGGKSFAVRLKATLLCTKHKGIRICIIRRTYPELIENHIKPLKEMLRCGAKDSIAKYNDSRKEMKFNNGSEILFRYCNAEKHLDNFQGVQFDVEFFDEATQLKQEWVEKIGACVRGVNAFP